MKHLYLFTATFPLGFQESFLETELPFLMEKFESVTICPFGGGNTQSRKLPEGCLLDTTFVASRTIRVIKGLFGIWRVFPMYVKDLTHNKALQSTKSFQRWFKQLLICSYYRQSKIIKQLLKHGNPQEDLVYFYWGAIYNSIAPFLKNHCKMVSRFHGDGDLWISKNVEGYSPTREEIVQALDSAIFISYVGESFFKKIHSGINTMTFHLGTIDMGVGIKSSDGVIRVLSCSAVYPLKRVDLIFETVKRLSEEYQVQWTHIGDGASFDDIKNKTKQCQLENLKIELLGRLPHPAVLEYYKKNPVDVFVNLSTNEGIPVAVMEAISFDVPVVATNVGGTAEIVNSKTGKLVSSNPSIDEVVNAYISVINSELNPRSLWEKEFNAKLNYSSFANYLYNI